MRQEAGFEALNNKFNFANPVGQDWNDSKILRNFVWACEINA